MQSARPCDRFDAGMLEPLYPQVIPFALLVLSCNYRRNGLAWISLDCVSNQKPIELIMKPLITLPFIFLSPLLALGMSHNAEEPMNKAPMQKHGSAMMSDQVSDHGMPDNKWAVAVIQATAGNDTSGYVLFEKTAEGVTVSGKIMNLSPGKHGFHVHQYGDLRKKDGTSAAGHFDPMDKPHGGPDDKLRHVGDLGNIEADENGVAEFSFVDEKLAFHGPASIIGRGLIVHAGEDDLTTQPTGAAGPRVGMAVIGYANPDL